MKPFFVLLISSSFFLALDAKITNDGVYCEAGSYFSVEKGRCLPCPVGTFKADRTVIGCKDCIYNPDKWKCQRCPEDSFAAEVGSVRCTKCLGFYSNANRDSCDYSRCKYEWFGYRYDLSPLRRYGPMHEVKLHPNASMLYLSLIHI